MTEEKTEKLLELLKEIKDVNNKDLYTHIQDVLTYIAFTNPSSGINSFEEISCEIRTKGAMELPESYHNYKELAQAAKPWLQSVYERYYEVKKVEEGEAPPEAAELPALGYIPDLLEDNEILEQAGVGFGEEESHLLMKSMKRLALKFEPKTIHLWGKIHGIDKDYYVVEGEKEGAGEAPPEVEARGTGVNKNVYWVTDSVMGEWVELPDALPNTINLARQIKKMFTGNPDVEVTTNPHFIGKEKDLLRAQIARISQLTSIIPKGYFKMQEESEREIVEVPEEEKKNLTFAELKQLANWCHFVPNILNCGRTVHLQPEPPKEEPPGYDPAIALKELEASDPYELRLKSLSQDVNLNECKTAWSIQVIGDSKVYKEDYKEGTFTNGIIMIKSLVWPGAYIFYKDNRWFNFYIGYGHKADQRDYYPTVPQIPLEVPVEIPEEPEPNPKEADNDEKLKDPAVVKSFIVILEETLADPAKFEEALTKTFDEVDVDHSGAVERKEAYNLLRGFARNLEIPLEYGPRAVDEFFKAFDTDKSGAISKEELADPLRGLLEIWIEVLREKLDSLPQEAAEESA